MPPETSSRDRRQIVPHVDDLGASHGANQAFLELARSGLVTCGSVMVPGAWFREIADAAIADPSLDLGVHLTLTSEWQTCRWAPISTVSRASGLIDPDGYFWHDLAGLRRHLVAEAAEAELRAQIERAISAGLKPTHIDAHMAGAMLPELLEAHVRLGREFGLFPVLPRSIGWAPDPIRYCEVIARLDAEGAPVVDHCRGTLAVAADSLDAGWRRLFAELSPGTTHLALHCTTPGDFSSMAPAHAGWRYDEYAMLARGFVHDLCLEHDVGATSTRALQQQWLQHLELGIESVATLQDGSAPKN